MNVLPAHSRHFSRFRRCSILFSLLVLSTPRLRAEIIWIEGETPVKSDVARHPWWYDKVKKDGLSGGDFISNWSQEKAGEMEYALTARRAEEYEFWVRANPVGTRLLYRLNSGDWQPIDMQGAQDTVNIAADGKIDLRFVAWVKVGKVALLKGDNLVAFRMDSKNNHHGMLDCFIFSTEPFEPHGALRPEQFEAIAKAQAEQDKGWFAFDPKPDPFDPSSGIDLRFLNEKQAGDGGFIQAKGPQFVHGNTGEGVRFWAVNGPPVESKDRDALRRCARMLAKHGVNLVRVHGGYFDEDGNVDPAKVRHAIDIVAAMKAEGIYTHFSIYFPLWLRPKPGTPWLDGYDGKKNPFAALFFNADFQKRYRSWWDALLLTPDENGKRLADDPAVMSAEIINEDSYFFWTFNPDAVPDKQMRVIEKQFGDWLKQQYGSIEAAMKKWDTLKADRDAPGEGRMAFRPLWNMFKHKTLRDQDAARFLLQSQRGFYTQTYQFLRAIGFKGAICASNWATASPEVFGPLEKYSYTPCDFIDRHGYFDCGCKGPDSGWSIRDGYTYADRSALRFDPEEPGKARSFSNTVNEILYDGKPSMISETTFNRPNRYRSEAPLYYACYGALQDTSAVVHFALDTGRWSVKPGFFMQPWTLMSPAMMGQFPAAAMIFRQGLVAPGDMLVDLELNVKELTELKGTPMPQDAAFDELRLKDVPKGTELSPGDVVQPLVHYAGRSTVHFTETAARSRVEALSPWVDRAEKVITSTNKLLRLNYGKGVLIIDAPAAQGASGNLKAAGAIDLKDMVISSDLSLGHIVAVSLDGKPLALSDRILLQVMSEEKATDFRTEPADHGRQRIVSVGHDPWRVKELSGAVKFKRSDAGKLKVTALDPNGYPISEIGHGDSIALRPDTLYYVVSR